MRSSASSDIAGKRPPRIARVLGYAGLLPQAAVVAVLASGSTSWHFAALSLGYAYAVLILSFLGGMWWGLAARRPKPPGWLWLAAITPSLIGLATAVPWAIGAAWPGPSMAALGISLLASLLVDRRLTADGIAPDWWMVLRVPLSVGLGTLTLAAAIIG